MESIPDLDTCSDEEFFTHYRKQVVSANPQAEAFRPRLDFRQRCAIYGLAYIGYTRAQLARAFDVHRKTVHSIVQSNSQHYKRVRETFVGLGPREFLKQYVTQGDIALANAHSPKAADAGIGTKVESGTPRKIARKHEGIQQVESVNGTPTFVTVEWRDGDKPGWYAVDKQGVTVGPFGTSTEARDAQNEYAA